MPLFPTPTNGMKLACVRACLNVLIESGHKICRQNLSKIKLCDWPNKLDAASWQVLNTTESVGWTDSNLLFWHLICCCCCRFSHSAHWLPTRKKLLHTVANLARGLLNREKNKNKKSGSAPTPSCALLVRIKNKKSRDASTCLGATQVGVMQVVSVRLTSVQGFLRLVS